MRNATTSDVIQNSMRRMGKFGLFAACGLGAFALSACGGSVELEAGQEYCFTYAEEYHDPIETSCDLVLMEDGRFVQIRPELLQAGEFGSAHIGYSKKYSIAGGKLVFPNSDGKRSFKLSVDDDKYRATLSKDGGYIRHMWIEANGTADMELITGYLALEIPELEIDETSIINKPFCFFEEGWIEEVREEYKTPNDSSCDRGNNIYVFHENDYLISIDGSTLGAGSSYSKQWDIEGYWDNDTGVPLPTSYDTYIWPEAYRDFKWSIGADGWTVTDVQAGRHKAHNDAGYK